MGKFTDRLRQVADRIDAVDTQAHKDKVTAKANEAKLTTLAKVRDAAERVADATRGEVTQF